MGLEIVVKIIVLNTSAQQSVHVDWASTVFSDVESEMRGLEWGRLV
jgi:hypothetical protein